MNVLQTVASGAKRKVAARPTRMSAKGLAFLMREEGCVLRPYNDAAGNATIGVGHLIHEGPVTRADQRRYAGFKHADALVLLARDVARFERAVASIPRPFRFQSRFDALVSFCFNVGTRPLEPGHSLGDALRLSGPLRTRRVASALLLYRYAGQRPILLARRQRERLLFLYGRYR